MDHYIECKTTIQAFSEFFSAHGYKKLEPVGITSGIDKSVYLMNSATNLFKPYIFKQDICIFAAQRSMRTQALNDYYSEDSESEYPTCFTSLGVYVSAELIEKLFEDAICWLATLGFDTNAIRIRVSAYDAMLIGMLKKHIDESIIQTDSKSEKYAHKYGDGLSGRSVKIDCFQDALGRYKNICYLIAIYKDGVLCGAEFASSDQQIILRRRELLYGVSVSAIADLLSTETFNQRRLADSLVGMTNLTIEGIRPNSSNTNGRTLKKYLNAISYFGHELHYSQKEIYDLCLGSLLLEHQAVSVDFKNDLWTFLSSVY